MNLTDFYKNNKSMSHPQKKWRYQWEALYSGQTHVFVIPFVIFGGISAIQVTPSNYSLQ